MNEQELRWQLRQLPREIEASRDLWPGIEARLAARPARRARDVAWLCGLALAASLALAAVFVPRDPLPRAARGKVAQAEIVQREAEAMTREYQAALSELEGAPVPGPLQPTLESLDRSVLDIRAAIAADPGSPFLLQQLQRTYARRLSLTQRAAVG
jgi:hypothetical protein